MSERVTKACPNGVGVGNFPELFAIFENNENRLVESRLEDLDYQEVTAVSQAGLKLLSKMDFRPLDAGHGLWPWALARGRPERGEASRRTTKWVLRALPVGTHRSPRLTAQDRQKAKASRGAIHRAQAEGRERELLLQIEHSVDNALTDLRHKL